MSKKPTRDEKRAQHDLKRFSSIEEMMRKIEPNRQYGMNEPMPVEFKDLENWT